MPFENSFVESHTPVRPIAVRQPLGDNAVIVVSIDERYPDGRHGVCPFLGLDDKCSVYADRPPVCKKFGDGSSAFMTCSYQAPDGRVRSRQERRQVERTNLKVQVQTLGRLERNAPNDADKAFVEGLEKTPDFMDAHARMTGRAESND